MKKLLYFIFILALYSLVNSCSSDKDFSQTVIIVDGDENNEGPDDTGNSDDSDDPIDPNEEQINAAICINGFAGVYPCLDYDLIGHLSLSVFGAEKANDCWGWTDPTTNKEYAIMGVNNGTAIIDISEATDPIFMGKIPSTSFSESIWRDIKVYNNHAFIVSEDQTHGMQIYDLTHLRDITNPPENLLIDFTYTGFGDAHNIAINEETGFAYAVGADNSSTHIVNIQNPLSPIMAGSVFGGFSHDAQIITYQGNDSDYQGQEIFFGCNAGFLIIADVTNKNNIETLASFTYSE